MICFQGIRVEQCDLQSVDAEAFEGLVSLMYLRLKSGQLIYPPSLQYMQKTLVSLHLDHNRITHISDAYFDGCEKLDDIDLRGNLLSFPPNIDDIADSLVSISLSMNQLSGVFIYFTKSFPKLSALHLEQNHITSFCMKQRRHLPSLAVLHLGSNNITHLNIELASAVRRNLMLFLASNPIRCETMKGWRNNCVQVSKDHFVCDGVVEIYFTECINNTAGRLHRMMTSSNGHIAALLVLCAGNSPVTGEFPSRRPVTRSFGIFFDLRLE